MLYGWIEVGASNNGIFNDTNNNDIIIRTINDTNKIILGNTDNSSANPTTASMYIKGNNVGVYKVPDNNVSLDVNGFAVLKTCQVGLSNTPTQLELNGQFIMKDTAFPFSSSSTNIIISNSNNEMLIGYPSATRFKITNGNGMTLNDTVTVTKDIFATGFNLTSDKRIKTNVIKSYALEDVNLLAQLNVCTYQLKDTNRVHATKGFIAQEVASVMPGVVHENAGLFTVDISQIVALNTSVIQYLLQRIETLQNYIESNK